MDSISMEGGIMDVESASSHVLFGHNTFFGGPLEGGFDGILNFVKVLDGLGDIDHHVGTSSLGSETPNLKCIIGVPFMLVSEESSTDLGILLGGNLLILNILGEFITERLGFHEESVMLVGRFGEVKLAGLISNSLSVGDDGVTLLDGALGKFFLKILKADLNMELTTSGNNVLTRFLSLNDDEGVGLGKLAETFNELGEVTSLFNLDGNTHDGGDRVFHDSDAMGIIVIGDGSLFDEVSIDSNESDSVTDGDIGDRLDFTSHHEDGSLDVLDVKVGLGAGLVVRSHNSDFLSSGNGSSEDTSESVESTFIVSGDHLGNEDHEGTLGIAFLDGLTTRIIDGSLIKVGSSVMLGLDGRGKFHDDHLKKSFSGVNPFLEDALEERLSFEILLFTLEGDTESDEHLVDDASLFLLHGVSAELDNGLHDEFNEASLELSTLAIIVLGNEFLFSLAEVVVSPKFLHELLSIELELIRVSSGEHLEGEGPSEKGGTETNGSSGGVNLLSFSHVFALVGRDDDVSVLNNTLEVLIHGLTIDLELEDTSINLVDEEDGLDFLSEGLSKHGLGLYANTFDVIDDDKGSVGNTESGGDF